MYEQTEKGQTLKIDVIARGVVIDHIKPGNSMKIYNYLNLAELSCTVALIQNVRSKKHGLKDIIKIENTIDIDLNALGYIDPSITVNIIEDGVITDKKKLKLPNDLENIIKCKNPRCITSIEQGIKQHFKLYDEEKQIYRCIYCDQEGNDFGLPKSF